MTDSQKLLEIAKQNNGIITAAMVAQAGISRGTLKYLSDTGALEKVSRGVYTLPEVWRTSLLLYRAGINEASFLWKQHCFYVI